MQPGWQHTLVHLSSPADESHAPTLTFPQLCTVVTKCHDQASVGYTRTLYPLGRDWCYGIVCLVGKMCPPPLSLPPPLLSYTDLLGCRRSCRLIGWEYCAAVSGLPLNPRHKTVFRAPMKWAPRVCQHTSNIWERRMEPEVWSAIRWLFLFFPSTDGCYELQSFGWSDGTPLISSCLLPW